MPANIAVGQAGKTLPINIPIEVLLTLLEYSYSLEYDQEPEYKYIISSLEEIKIKEAMGDSLNWKESFVP